MPKFGVVAMFDRLSFFRSHRGVVAVSLPLDPEAVITEWSALRQSMLRERQAAFTRNEWAYLLAFLDSRNLHEPFKQAFGEPLNTHDQPVSILHRPRGAIGLWLPNNVSLLGPLTLILLSLTGQRIRIKVGSHSENLTEKFLTFAIDHLPENGILSSYLLGNVRCEAFDRGDPRNSEMAAETQVRILFGSNAAARAIDALPHPLESLGFYFVDRRSEAWLEENVLTDDILAKLLRVFAIYGQAGCTSPKRVVLLDGNDESARQLRDRLVDLWPKIFLRDPPMHVASSNLMTRQWAAALHWNARTTFRQGAVIACGDQDLIPCEALMLLTIVPLSAEQAWSSLSANIQTIGHALKDPGSAHWLKPLAGTAVKRFVPIEQMHHFGPMWDGWEFWRGLFETMEVQL
jgi:hypothetical protein